MRPEIYKLCADSLRTFSKEKYDIKLKAAHAHELVAAYFGYRSKNTMLADINYPVSYLSQAEAIVMMPDDFIDQRRKQLEGLPAELPDSYTLGEAVFASFFSDGWWASDYPPFRSFNMLAKFLLDSNDAYQYTFKYYRDMPMHHIVDIKDEENSVFLTVIHAHETADGELLGIGKNTIKLQRIAGRIGFSEPQVSTPETWTAGAKVSLGKLEAQS